jgi:mannan endo-1,6-alpha-mannosidase
MPRSGGSNGVTCGFKWTDKSTYDGTSGVGQQMSALSVIQATLLSSSPALVTNTTGGTSTGDPSAGTAPQSNPAAITPATAGDRAGAGFLTAIFVVGVIGGVGFMVTGI